jgi:hypothetical protein
MNESKNRTGEAAEMLHLTAMRYKQPALTEQEESLWLADLRELCIEHGCGLDTIKAAFRAHIRDPKHGSFMPKLADIVRHLPQGQSVYPEAAAAWAIAVKAQDEANSVCWTPLIAEAFFAAKPLLDARDTFGARSAFMAFYERAVQADKAKPVDQRRSAWTLTLGHDVQLREVVREQAVAQGLLPAPEAAPRLAHDETVNPEVKARVFAQIEQLSHKIAMVKPATVVPDIAQSKAPMPPVERLRLAA